MTATTADTVREGGGHGNGLPASPTDTSTRAACGDIVAQRQPDGLAVERTKCLPTSGLAVESNTRPTAVVGRTLSGKSRCNHPGITLQTAT